MNLLTKQEIEALVARLEGPTMTAAKDLIAAYFGDKSKCLASIPADPSRDADLLVTADIKAAATLARTALALMAQLEDAKAAQAMVVEQVEKAIKATMLRLGQHPDIKRIMAPQVMWGAGDSCITAIRALADPSGVETLAALRAERDALLEEGAALSSWQCLWTDGKAGLSGDDYGNQFCQMQRDRDRLAASEAKRNESERILAQMTLELEAAEARVAARVKPLVFSEFRDGGCVGRPHSFQYFITQDHDGRFWCHHDTSQHDSLAKAQEHAQAHYQTAALAAVTPLADTVEGRT